MSNNHNLKTVSLFGKNLHRRLILKPFIRNNSNKTTFKHFILNEAPRNNLFKNRSNKKQTFLRINNTKPHILLGKARCSLEFKLYKMNLKKLSLLGDLKSPKMQV
jgi:hypothetical protein